MALRWHTSTNPRNRFRGAVLVPTLSAKNSNVMINDVPELCAPAVSDLSHNNRIFPRFSGVSEFAPAAQGRGIRLIPSTTFFLFNIPSTVSDPVFFFNMRLGGIFRLDCTRISKNHARVSHSRQFRCADSSTCNGKIIIIGQPSESYREHPKCDSI